MAEEYVRKEDFDKLEKKVLKIEETVDQTANVLSTIDKKVDGILIKLEDTDKMNALTLKPINDRLLRVEDNQKWIWRTIGGSLIAIAVKVIFDLSHFVQ